MTKKCGSIWLSDKNKNINQKKKERRRRFFPCVRGSERRRICLVVSAYLTRQPETG